MALPGTVLQKTLKSSIHCRGVALHTGAHVGMTLYPAPVDRGIVFRRADQGGAEVRAVWRNVKESPLCTMLDNGDGVSVATVEHLLAAFAGCEIDNAVVELDGPEVPAMDGSAAPFVFLIECAGIAEQDAPRRAIKILKPVSVGDDGRSAELSPGDALTMSFTIDFAANAIRHQSIRVMLDPDTFKNEIASARTFGFAEEIDALRGAGLARGGSLDNAVVIGGGEVLNRDGLRFKDEFVRHKVLDAFGDLYLAGAPILGHFSGHRSGHALNCQLLRALFADRSAWTWTRLARVEEFAPGWREAGRRASA
jgi:UDP-3-O-[3-hydroxymyristoyl] N-acetylglucosamine deacetylase